MLRQNAFRLNNCASKYIRLTKIKTKSMTNKVCNTQWARTPLYRHVHHYTGTAGFTQWGSPFLKGEFANFSIDLSDASKNDIVMTENETLIERQYFWNEAINHIATFSPNNVILRGIRLVNKKNWRTLLLKLYRSLKAFWLGVYLLNRGDMGKIFYC